MKKLFFAIAMAVYSISLNAQCRVYMPDGFKIGTVINGNYTPPGRTPTDDTDYIYMKFGDAVVLYEPTQKVHGAMKLNTGMVYNPMTDGTIGKVIGLKFISNNKMLAYGNEQCSRADVFAATIFYYALTSRNRPK